MSDLLGLAPEKALDSNGDPVPGAKAYFYKSGTTDPVSVYSDSGLTTAHPSPLVADAGGVFAQVFYTGSNEVKCVVTTSSDVTLSTVDPCSRSSSGSRAASALSFSPITGNPATNVQDAIANNTTDLESKVGTGRNITTGNGLQGGGNLSEDRTVSVDFASNTDAATGISTTKVMNPAASKHARAAALSAKIKTFESAAQTITAGGLLTLAHSLTVEPLMISLWLQCTTAEGGYSVGDRVLVSAFSGDSASDVLNAVYADATNINIRFDNGPTQFQTAHKSSGAKHSITNANWSLYVKATAFT